MYLRVVEAKYVPRYQVDIAFNDGTHRVVDFDPFLKQARNPMFTKYRRLKEFKSFHIHDGDLMWGDYEMIFPIMDLYCDNILKVEEAEPSHLVLSETAAPAKTILTKKAGVVSCKKLKHKKNLQHV
jgi:hypothetical protein